MSQATLINGEATRTRNFRELTAEEQREHLQMKHKASISGNREEYMRLSKMYEFSYKVARGIQLAWGQEFIDEMKEEGFLFPEGF